MEIALANFNISAFIANERFHRTISLPVEYPFRSIRATSLRPFRVKNTLFAVVFVRFLYTLSHGLTSLKRF